MSNKKVLLISETQVKEKAMMDHNVNSKALQHLIQNVQVMHLESILGKTLYDSLTLEVDNKKSDSNYNIQPLTLQLLKEYVWPYLAYAVLSEFMVISSQRITNKGPLKMNDNSASAASTDEIEFVKNYYNQYVGVYKGKLIEFVKANKLSAEGEFTDTDNTAQAIGWHLDLKKKNYSGILGSASDAALSIQEFDPVWSAAKGNYYTKAEVDALVAAVNINESDPVWESEKANYATQSDLASKADLDHTHPISEVNGLQAALDSKAPGNHTHSIFEVDNLANLLSNKSNLGHTHSALDITSGLLDAARLGTGSTGGGTYLAGDSTWKSFPTNITAFTNNAGYVTSSALSSYLTTSTAATKYVPYTGATNGVDLGTNSIAFGQGTVDKLIFSGVTSGANAGYSSVRLSPSITSGSGAGHMHGLYVTPNYTAGGADQTFNGVYIQPSLNNPSGYSNVTLWALNVSGAVNQQGGNVYLSSTGTTRTIIGTTTDDNSNRLQVAGNVKVTGNVTATQNVIATGKLFVGTSTDYSANIQTYASGTTDAINVRVAMGASGYALKVTTDLGGGATVAYVTMAGTAAFNCAGSASNAYGLQVMGNGLGGTQIFYVAGNNTVGVAGTFTQSGGAVFLNSAGTNRTIIGTNVDDGSNRLQVSGNVKVTGTISSPGTGSNSERFGASSSASSPNGLAIGYASNAGGSDGGTAVGSNSLVSNSGGSAFGLNAKSYSGYSIAIGYGANAGTSAAASELRATAVGALSSATGYFTAAIGGYSSASGAQSTALGVSSSASNVSAIAMGTFALASGLRSIAIGGSTADGATRTSATHADSIVIGYGASSTSANQLMIGSATTNYAMYLNGSLSVTVCPDYADNATAIAAGLAVGRVYRTGDLLKIVH